MAITKVTEQTVEQPVEFADGQTSAVRKYLVFSSTKVTDLATLRNATDGTHAIPGDSDAYSATLTACKVRSKSVEAVNEHAPSGSYVYRVTVNYTSLSGLLERTADESPLSKPPKYYFDYTSYTEDVLYTEDSYQRLITNTAGYPFEPLYQRTNSSGVFTIVRNEASFDYEQSWQYRNAVNSDTFTVDGQTIGVGCAKMNRISAEKLTENGVTFYQVTYSIEVRETTAVTNAIFQRWYGTGYAAILDVLYPFRLYARNDGYRDIHANSQKGKDLNDLVNVAFPLRCDNTSHYGEFKAFVGINGDQTPPADVLEFIVYPELPFSVFGFV